MLLKTFQKQINFGILCFCCFVFYSRFPMFSTISTTVVNLPVPDIPQPQAICCFKVDSSSK